jgi:hypothetical protein
MAGVSTRSPAPAEPSGADSSSSWSTRAWTRSAAFVRRALRSVADGRPGCPVGLARQEPGGASDVSQRVGACGSPIAVHLGHRASSRPGAIPQAGERIWPAPARVGPRPVIRGGRAAVAGVPGAHRFAHPFARPLPCDRAGMTLLAVFVRIALAVARAGRRAAASAGTVVAGLDLACLLAGWVLRA